MGDKTLTAGTAKNGQNAEFKAQQGKGRPKGATNKVTREVKEMIIQALSNAGGVDYLTRQADENPNAFMTLIGKVLPLQVAGTNKDGEAAPLRIELIGVRP